MFGEQSIIILQRRLAINDKEDELRSHFLRRIWNFLFSPPRSKEEIAHDIILRTMKEDLTKAKRQFKIIKAAIIIFGDVKRGDIDGDDDIQLSPYKFL